MNYFHSQTRFIQPLGEVFLTFVIDHIFAVTYGYLLNPPTRSSDL